MDFTEAYDDTSTSVGMAARMGKPEMLQELLQKGKPTNGHDNRGWRPLHEAADGGHVECVRLLLSCDDAEVDAFTHEGTSALHLACKSGSQYAEVVKLLLAAGADPNMKDGDDWVLPLPKAVANSNIQIVEMLLDAGADPNRVDYFYKHPLHVASEKGLLEIAQFLIKRGSDLNWTDDADRTVLHVLLFPPLVCDTLIPLINLFIEKGCDVDAKMIDGTTPLMLAIQSNAREAVSTLLELGADPNAIKDSGIIALHYAIQFGPDSEITDNSDHGHLEEQQFECSFVLRKILDLTSRDLIIPDSLEPVKYSIYHLAIQWDKFNALKLLIEKKIPPDAFIQETSDEIFDEKDVDLFRQAPLLMSIGIKADTPLGFLLSKPLNEKSLSVAKFMIDKGSSCNPVTSTCLPPLVAAVKHQRSSYDQRCPGLDIVKYLLSNGADVMHKVRKSDVLPTALHVSSLFNVSAFFTLLQWGLPIHEVYCKETLVKLKQMYHSERYYAIYPLFPWRVISWLSVLNMFVPQLPLDTKGVFDTERMVEDEHLTAAWNNLSNLIESPKDLQSLCVLAVRQSIAECRGWSNLSSHIEKLQIANASLPQIIMERLLFKQIQKVQLFQHPPLSVMQNYSLHSLTGSWDEDVESDEEDDDEVAEMYEGESDEVVESSEEENDVERDEENEGSPRDIPPDDENPQTDDSFNKDRMECISECHVSDTEEHERICSDSEETEEANSSRSGTKRKKTK